MLQLSTSGTLHLVDEMSVSATRAVDPRLRDLCAQPIRTQARLLTVRSRSSRLARQVPDGRLRVQAVLGGADIQNELYFTDHTWMLFGDAKEAVGKLVKQLSSDLAAHPRRAA